MDILWLVLRLEMTTTNRVEQRAPRRRTFPETPSTSLACAGCPAPPASGTGGCLRWRTCGTKSRMVLSRSRWEPSSGNKRMRFFISVTPDIVIFLSKPDPITRNIMKSNFLAIWKKTKEYIVKLIAYQRTDFHSHIQKILVIFYFTFWSQRLVQEN
jgi:hypothetical protein